MKLHYSAAFVLLFYILANFQARAHFPPPGLPDSPESHLHDKHEVVRLFLQAADRGEVNVFGHQFSADMLRPTRVEYVYELNREVPDIRVYAEIKVPLAIPDNDTCEVRALSAILDDKGNILEVQVHVWPKGEK